MKTFSAYLIGLILAVFLSPFSGCGAKPARQSQPGAGPAPDRAARVAQQAHIEEVKGLTPPDAIDLIKAYGSRNTGSPGWRRVLLELLDDGEVTRALTVVNLWKQVGKDFRTLFVLEQPQGLSGTDYLLIENPDISDTTDMKVHLFLPAGQRPVLEIKPSNFNEGLLGSDFTYSDLRMRLPDRGFRYRVAGLSSLLDEPVWVVEAEPASQAARQTYPWALARFFLARNLDLLLGADYYSDPNGKTCVKQVRVESYEEVDGVRIQTRMVMFASQSRCSVLTLKDVRFKERRLHSSLFSAAELPKLSEKVRQGWSPESLDHTSLDDYAMSSNL